VKLKGAGAARSIRLARVCHGLHILGIHKWLENLLVVDLLPVLPGRDLFKDRAFGRQF
jgi:hypothetical protein